MNVNTLLNPLRPTNQPPHWEVIYRPLDELKRHPANPRPHSKKQIRQIAESIKTPGANSLARDGAEGNPLALPPTVKPVAMIADAITIIRRWQRLTGGSACHAASGRGFDDLAKEAEAANAV